MSSKPKRFRRKYKKGTDHKIKDGPAAGKGKHRNRNRAIDGKKVTRPGRFETIRKRINARNRALKKKRAEGKK